MRAPPWAFSSGKGRDPQPSCPWRRSRATAPRPKTPPTCAGRRGSSPDPGRVSSAISSAMSAWWTTSTRPSGCGDATGSSPPTSRPQARCSIRTAGSPAAGATATVRRRTTRSSAASAPSASCATRWRPPPTRSSACRRRLEALEAQLGALRARESGLTTSVQSQAAVRLTGDKDLEAAMREAERLGHHLETLRVEQAQIQAEHEENGAPSGRRGQPRWPACASARPVSSSSSAPCAPTSRPPSTSRPGWRRRSATAGCR